MYVYDYWMKDGSRKQFLTDNRFFPDEVCNFADAHKEEITSAFCDHFNMTVESFLGGDKLENYQVICKYYKEEEDD